MNFWSTIAILTTAITGAMGAAAGGSATATTVSLPPNNIKYADIEFKDGFARIEKQKVFAKWNGINTELFAEINNTNSTDLIDEVKNIGNYREKMTMDIEKLVEIVAK